MEYELGTRTSLHLEEDDNASTLQQLTPPSLYGLCCGGQDHRRGEEEELNECPPGAVPIPE